MQTDLNAAAKIGLPEGVVWTPEQVQQAMKQMAAASASRWAEAAWARLYDGILTAAASVQKGEATRDEAIAALDRLKGILYAEVNDLFAQVADSLTVTDPADRSALGTDCDAAFTVRWAELVAGTPIGIAGHA